jgi:hypothetical protein
VFRDGDHHLPAAGNGRWQLQAARAVNTQVAYDKGQDIGHQGFEVVSADDGLMIFHMSAANQRKLSRDRS